MSARCCDYREVGGCDRGAYFTVTVFDASNTVWWLANVCNQHLVAAVYVGNRRARDLGFPCPAVEAIHGDVVGSAFAGDSFPQADDVR